MTKAGLDFDEASILRRLDRSSPDALLKSLAMELARLGHSQALLQARLATMESLQAMADRIVDGDGTGFVEAYPHHVSIMAANSNFGAHGFYRLEHDTAGEPYRWTGPDRQFSFQFFIDRRAPARFELKFGQLYADVPVERLLCYADGEPVALAILRAPGCYEATGVMPPRSDSGGSVLTFVCPQMASPESRGSSDSRLLGLLFRSLTVETELEWRPTAASGQPAAGAPEIEPSATAAPSVTAAAAQGATANPPPEPTTLQPAPNPHLPRNAAPSRAPPDAAPALAGPSAPPATLNAVAEEKREADAPIGMEAYPRQVSIIPANSNLGARGFYGVEQDSTGAPYRWTGPDRQFSFQFFIDRKAPARFTLKFGQLYSGAPAEELKCYADGEPAALTVLRGPGGYEATGVVPPREGSGESVLAFVCPRMESPESRGRADSRVLGLLFRLLTVETEATTESQPAAASEPPLAAPTGVVAPDATAVPTNARNSLSAATSEAVASAAGVEAQSEKAEAKDGLLSEVLGQ